MTMEIGMETANDNKAIVEIAGDFFKKLVKQENQEKETTASTSKRQAHQPNKTKKTATLREHPPKGLSDFNLHLNNLTGDLTRTEHVDTSYSGHAKSDVSNFKNHTAARLTPVPDGLVELLGVENFWRESSIGKAQLWDEWNNNDFYIREGVAQRCKALQKQKRLDHM